MNSLLEEKTTSTSQGKTEEITLKNRPIDDRNGAGDSDSPKKKESKHGFKKSKSSSKSKTTQYASKEDLNTLSDKICDLTDLVTTSFQKWGPMINEISHAYSDYQQGRSTNYDSDESDDTRS